MQAILDTARRRAGPQPSSAPNQQDSTEILLPVTIPIREGMRYSLLYKLCNPDWKSPDNVASCLAHTLGLSEAEEKSAAEALSKAIASYARHAQCLDRREETRVQLEVYVRVGDKAFRDILEVDLGAFAGVTSMLVGTVQQYVTSVCADLSLDPNVWITPITKKIYSLLQEATEDLKQAPHEVKLMPPLREADAVRDVPSNMPRVEDFNPELDAYEAERSKQREEKRIRASSKRRSRQTSEAGP